MTELVLFVMLIGCNLLMGVSGFVLGDFRGYIRGYAQGLREARREGAP